MPPASRRSRVASVQVLGAPVRRPDHNDRRTRLLTWIVDTLVTQSDWGRIDALLLPAGYFRLELALGPLASSARSRALETSDIAFTCRRASERLWSMARALLVIGLDTKPYLKGFSGDQMMFAWRDGAVVGSARKFFPSPLDTALDRRRPYLLFEEDAGSASRYIKLPSGHSAMLCVCYDALVFSELALGPTVKRTNIRYVQAAGGRPEAADFERRDAVIDCFGRTLREQAPTVGLIAVHGFEHPGRETRWQRHGIATASAGLDGGLALAASHFRQWLPDPDDPRHASLASRGVGQRHLGLGLHRRARKHPAIDGFLVTVPGAPDLAAVVRLIES